MAIIYLRFKGGATGGIRHGERGGSLGQLGSKRVKSPVTFLTVRTEALKYATNNRDGLNLKRVPNNVDRMTLKNRSAQAIHKIEPADVISYHVIVGDRGKGCNPDHTKPVKGDGFVPCWSSRMEGA